MHHPRSVRVFGALTDEHPFVIIPLLSKMPLGALALAMVAIGQMRTGRAEVALGEEYWVYSNVRIEGSTLHSDREV